MDELTLADYLAILKRWKKCFLVTFGILLALSILFVLSWSNYRSIATVEVEQPQVAPIMTTPTGVSASDMPESLVDLRISKIEESVTSPATLVDIITKYDLYPHTRNSEPMSTVAKDMAKKIKLTLISSTIANPAATAKVSADQLSAIAFTLSFDYSDPQIAREVNNEIVTRFLDEDLKERREDAEATSDFLGNQIKALEGSLAEQEQKIAKFQDEHGISGPEAVMFNQQAAASATMSMQNIDSQLASNEGSQGGIRAQLSTVDPYSRVIADGQVMTTPAIQLKALQAQYASLTAQYGPEHPDVIKVRHQIESLKHEVGVDKNGSSNVASLKAQIRDIETNLAAAKQTSGPDNPDVVSLQDQLTSLQSQLATAQKSPASSNGLKQDADNPAYLALMSQLNSLQEQHKSLLAQREAMAAQQTKYEEALTKDPGLEQEMAVLSRDHDNAEQRYRELKERKMAADMDVQMIQDHKGERLVVIDPPDLPLHTHPRGILLFLAGLFVSIIGGFTSVVVAQMFNQSIIGAKQLTSLVGVAPLVTIPHIYTAEEKYHLSHQMYLEILRDLFVRSRDSVMAKMQPKGEQ